MSYFFHFPNSLSCKEYVKFYGVKFIIFFPLDCVSGVVSKKTLSKQDKDFLLFLFLDVLWF